MYFGDWSNAQDMCTDFEIDPSELNGKTILFAAYTYENYEGRAFVLLRDDVTQELFEVNGGHCSCYELEGQWGLEETSKEALQHRLGKGTVWDAEPYVNELMVIVGGL